MDYQRPQGLLKVDVVVMHSINGVRGIPAYAFVGVAGNDAKAYIEDILTREYVYGRMTYHTSFAPALMVVQ